MAKTACKRTTLTFVAPVVSEVVVLIQELQMLGEKTLLK